MIFPRVRYMNRYETRHYGGWFGTKISRAESDQMICDWGLTPIRYRIRIRYRPFRYAWRRVRLGLKIDTRLGASFWFIWVLFCLALLSMAAAHSGYHGELLLSLLFLMFAVAVADNVSRWRS